MATEYKKGDDLANLEALKEEMFKRAFQGDKAAYGFEIGAVAANAYANLIKAQVALKTSGEKPTVT